MDVCESEKAVGKQSTTVSLRPPLVSADKNGTTRRSRTRQVSSRYMSPTPSAASVPKRCPSPNPRRPPATSTVSLPKRAISAERKRPSTPSSPPSPSPSTPIKDIAAAMLLTPRKTPINKSPESLWPSTMRSLSVSFQADTFAVPIGRKEKTVSRAPSDRTLKPSSNVAHKGETPTARKPTPEKKRSPLRGKNSADQLENSKPVDSLSPRLVDQHRWPSRTSVRTSTFPNRSDATEKVNKTSSLSHSRIVTPPLRRSSLDGTSKPVQKSVSDFLIPTSHVESEKEMFCGSSFHDGSQKVKRPSSSSSSERTSLMNAAARTHSLPIPRSRPSSPSVSRGISPSRGKIVTPSSRGTSPARVRPSSPSRQPQDTTSVLSFIADIKKSKKAANDIEDVHQLRLLYNRHLQWRYAIARTYAAMHSQKAKAEKMLYNIWRIILDLSDSVRKKRSSLQQLKLKLNLYSVLVNQAGCLDEWASIERDHTNSLTWAIQDLQASTLRIPVTEGTRVDMKSVKGAVYSAVHVMKAMASSLGSILPQVEGTNSLVSELADVAARERAMLNECESLFGSIAALQVEEHSLRTHLLQMETSLEG
ncbi:hypothetical protein C2S51_002135 [Perilla frutescens var. frutescens]|nr:hypothetical protein C2S51_002135 [Perilla frutescens var. frutescens]